MMQALQTLEDEHKAGAGDLPVRYSQGNFSPQPLCATGAVAAAI